MRITQFYSEVQSPILFSGRKQSFCSIVCRVERLAALGCDVGGARPLATKVVGIKWIIGGYRKFLFRSPTRFLLLVKSAMCLKSIWL